MSCCGNKNEVETTSVISMPDEKTPTTPVRIRRPRDVVFFLLFLCMLGAMGYLANYSIASGDPYRYAFGTDSWGNICGKRNLIKISGVDSSGLDHRTRSFQFHLAFSDFRVALNPLTFLSQENAPAVLCVNACPTQMTTCQEILTENGYNLSSSIIDERVCTMPFDMILPHNSVINRCLPSQLIQVAPAISSPSLNDSILPTTNSSDADILTTLKSAAITFAEFFFTSMAKYWKDAVYLNLIAFGVCFVMIILLQIFTRVVVVLSVVLGGLGSIALTAYLWYNYAVVKGYIDEGAVANAIGSATPAGQSILSFIEDQLSSNVNATGGSGQGALNTSTLTVTTSNVSGLLDSFAFSAIRQSVYLFPGAIIVTVLTVIILIILIWVRKSLCLVVKIFDEAGRAVASMPCLLLEPVKTLVAMTGVIAYGFIIAAFILSIGVPTVVDDGFVIFVERENTSNLALLAAHIFGCLWMLEFVSACQQLILAGAICDWFFSRQLKQNKRSCISTLCPATLPTTDLILYRLGTAALGSLIIAVVQFMRIALAYVQQKLKGKDSDAVKVILKCMACCLACFEKILKYINRNAYICAAMYGESFCASGKRALRLLITNATHVFALNCIGGFCLFLSKMAVVVITGFSSICWFKQKLGKNAKTSEYLVPAVIACVGSYIIALCFFNVYGMAVDTIFLCFCDDQERNNGDDRPYYSSVALQKYMNEVASQHKKENRSKRQTAPHESARAVHPELHKERNKLKKEVLKTVPTPRAAHENLPKEFETFFMKDHMQNNDDDLSSTWSRTSLSHVVRLNAGKPLPQHGVCSYSDCNQEQSYDSFRKSQMTTPLSHDTEIAHCSLIRSPFLPSTPIHGSRLRALPAEKKICDKSFDKDPYLLAFSSPEFGANRKINKSFFASLMENSSLPGSISSKESDGHSPSSYTSSNETQFLIQ